MSRRGAAFLAAGFRALGCITTLACTTLACATPVGADAGQRLPMRLGVYVPIAIGIPKPCAMTQLEIAVVWNGRQLEGIGRDIVSVTLLKRAVYLPGFPQPGPQYQVVTQAPGNGGRQEEKWTFSGTDTVVLNADPILWCARSLDELKRARGEKR